MLEITLFIIYVKGKTNLKEESIPSLDIEEDNIMICKEMLKIIENNHTQVEKNKDEKTELSYYNHSKDIIILKANNKGSSRILQIAHECIHTTQKKEYLMANKFFSNLQIIYFLFALIYVVNNEVNELLIISFQLLILLGTLFVKTVIEGDACYRSIVLANEYLKEKLNNEKRKKYIDETSKMIYNLVSVYYFNFFSQGITMIIINTIISLIM